MVLLMTILYTKREVESMNLLQEQEMRTQRAEQKPMSPQEERREMIAAVLIGAFLGYLITEVIFAGYR